MAPLLFIMSGAGDVTSRVQRVISESLCVEREKVTLSADLMADLRGDSLDLIEAAMQVEDEFDVEFSAAEVSAFATVKDVVDLVERRLTES